MQKYHLSLVTFGLGMHFHSSQMGMFPLQRWEDRCHSGMPGCSPVWRGNQQAFTSGASVGSWRQPLIPWACFISHFLHHVLSAPIPKELLSRTKEKSLCKMTPCIFPPCKPRLLFSFVLGKWSSIFIPTPSPKVLDLCLLLSPHWCECIQEGHTGVSTQVHSNQRETSLGKYSVPAQGAGINSFHTKIKPLTGPCALAEFLACPSLV